MAMILKRTAKRVQKTTPTVEESTLFATQLVLSNIGEVLYLRDVLPKHCFETRDFQGETVHTFNKLTPLSKKLHRNLAGIHDAMEKRYLKDVIVGLGEDRRKTSTAVDVFTIRIDYDEQMTPIVQLKSTSPLDYGSSSGMLHKAEYGGPVAKHRSVVSMLRNLATLLGTFEPLRCQQPLVQFKLTYHPWTPANYEPPGFTACSTDKFKFGDRPTVVTRLGRVVDERLIVRTKVESVSMHENDSDVDADEGRKENVLAKNKQQQQNRNDNQTSGSVEPGTEMKHVKVEEANTDNDGGRYEGKISTLNN